MGCTSFDKPLPSFERVFEIYIDTTSGATVASTRGYAPSTRMLGTTFYISTRKVSSLLMLSSGEASGGPIPSEKRGSSTLQPLLSGPRATVIRLCLVMKRSRRSRRRNWIKRCWRTWKADYLDDAKVDVSVRHNVMLLICFHDLFGSNGLYYKFYIASSDNEHLV